MLRSELETAGGLLELAEARQVGGLGLVVAVDRVVLA